MTAHQARPAVRQDPGEESIHRRDGGPHVPFRTHGSPRGVETFGYASGLEEGERLRGKMREPLGGEKRIRRNAERGADWC